MFSECGIYIREDSKDFLVRTDRENRFRQEVRCMMSGHYSLPPLKLGGSVAASFDGTSGPSRSRSQDAPARKNNRLYDSAGLS